MQGLPEDLRAELRDMLNEQFHLGVKAGLSSAIAALDAIGMGEAADLVRSVQDATVTPEKGSSQP